MVTHRDARAGAPPFGNPPGRFRPAFLIFGFSALLVALALTAAVALDRMGHINAGLERVVETYNVHGALAQRMHHHARERAMALHAMAIIDDPFIRDELFLRLRDHGEAFLIAREQLTTMALTPGERALLDHQRILSAAAGALQYEVLDLLAEGRLVEARERLLREALPAQERALRVIDSFTALQQEHNREALEVTSARYDDGARSVLTLAVVGLLLGVAVAVVAVRRNGLLMGRLGDANRALAASNAELEAVREALERRVEERTAALSEANEELRHEVAERERTQRRLTYLANYDGLTTLPNRTLFNEHLKLTLAQARRRRTQVALFFIDLDGFKRVNDRLGHEAGDRLLQEVGARLKSRVRGEDMAARIGGDEFTLILGDVNRPQDAEVVAEKVLDAMSRPFQVNAHTVQVGVSIGIALYPGDTADTATLIRYADDAMYRVKNSGKNGYRFHGDEALQEAG